MAQLSNSRETAPVSPSFAKEVFDAYEALKAEQGSADVYALATETAAKYQLEGNQLVEAMSDDPRYQSLGLMEKAKLMGRQFLSNITSYITDFFTGSAENASKTTTAVYQELGDLEQGSRGPRLDTNQEDPAYEEGEDIEEDNDEEEEEDNDEEDTPTGIIGKAQQMGEDAIDAGQEAAMAVYQKGAEAMNTAKNKLIKEERRHAMSMGVYSTLKYTINNDLADALGAEFLRDFGNGVYNNAAERMEGMDPTDFEAIATMDAHLFLQAMETQQDKGFFIHRGHPLAVEHYQPLYDFLKEMEGIIPVGVITIRDALMLTCVTNEEERYVARALYATLAFGTKTPAQLQYLHHLRQKWGSDRGSYASKNFLEPKSVQKAKKEIALNTKIFDQLDQRYAAVEASTTIKASYDKQLKPIKKQIGNLSADIQTLEQKLSKKSIFKTTLETKTINALLETKTKELDTLKKKREKLISDKVKAFTPLQNNISKYATDINAFNKELQKNTGKNIRELQKTLIAKHPLKESELLLTETKRLQEQFEKKWGSTVVSKRKGDKLSAAKLSPEVYKDFEMVKRQYEVAYSKLAAKRKVLYKTIKEENKKLLGLRDEVLKHPDNSTIKANFATQKAKVSNYGKALQEQQKNMKDFGKEFLRKNRSTLRTIEAEAGNGFLRKQFKGSIFKHGTLFVVGAAITKQTMDVFRGTNTMEQAVSDTAHIIGTAFIPVYGTYQDYRAAYNGLDETGRVLSGKERAFRAAMVPVGVVADVTSLVGMGLLVRGAIGSAKLMVRGGKAAYHANKTRILSSGLASQSKATIATAAKQGTKEAVVKTGARIQQGWDKIAAIPTSVKNGIISVPGKMLMNKGKVAIGTAIVGGMHLMATLEPVGETTSDETLSFSQDDFSHLAEEFPEGDLTLLG